METINEIKGMIKVIFNKAERLEDKYKFRSKKQICVTEIKRTPKVWYFEVSRGVFYFNYNNSQIIKSIEKVNDFI